jgi:hypothetical protein
MRIPPILYGILVLAIFLGTILGFQAAGIWSVSGKTTSNGDTVQPLADDVNTIKGWMTLEQITTVYNVSLVDILTQFNLPVNTPASTAIKDLESGEFSVSNLRTWLQSRIQPAQPVDAATPYPQATETLAVMPTETASVPLPTEHVVADKTITGKTTFQDLLNWGVKEETIRLIIGGDLPSPDAVIKDYVTQQGMEFSSVKTALQAEVDKTK